MFDFGIKKFLLKILLIIVAGIVLICVMNGCALAEKTDDDSVSVTTTAYVDPLELVEAKAEAEVDAIRAKEEKWRLLVWIVGGAAAAALLMRSPLDRFRKRKVEDA